MNKYLAIIDRKTVSLAILCALVTYACFQFNYSYDLNITLFSIAIIFPLVFTIREAFKRRDNAIKFLSIFKSSINVVYHSFENNNKLTEEQKKEVHGHLHETTDLFLNALKSEDINIEPARLKLKEVFTFVNAHREFISLSVAMKIFRFMKDAHEGIENTVGIKMHGTPVSLRAYCLVFIYLFPLIYTPSLVNSLTDVPQWIVYLISILHGFILISLYNVQEHMEDPFDQVGLDDIKLDEFDFRDNTKR